jgi:ferredoxin
MAETTSRITKVWIEDGCISCSLCSDLVPDVFQVENGDVCVIRADAGVHFDVQSEGIREAARDCPVEVIHVEDDA